MAAIALGGGAPGRRSLLQHAPEPGELRLGQEPLAFAGPVSGDAQAGVFPVLDQAPHLRHPEDVRQRGDRDVRLRRYPGHALMKLDRVLRAHRGQRDLAHGRDDVVGDHRAADRQRPGLALHGRVLAKVAFGDFGHRGPRAGFRRRALRHGVFSGHDPRDRERRATPGPIGVHDPVAPERDPPGAARPPRLRDIDPGPGGIRPDPEPGQAPVPEHGVGLHRQGVHRAVGDPPFSVVAH